MMNKILLVLLVLLGVHFTPAFPAPLKDDHEMDPNSPRDVTSTDHVTTVDEEKRTPLQYGTALGHNVKGSKEDNFAVDWRKAFESLYGGSKKRGLGYGTALGHRTKPSGGDNFDKDWLKTFKALYPDADKRGVGFGTALGHGVTGNDDYGNALEKMYKELYGKRK